MSFDVFGMCNPLYDIQAEVSDEALAKIGVTKGAMQLVDQSQQEAIVSHIVANIVNAEAGGSGANTTIGLALLGAKACYAGKVANDEHGKLYLESLNSKGVHTPTPVGEGTTGISVILITPDAERTMCTFLGISRELQAADIDLESLRASKYLYVTGYLWDTDSQKEAVLHAMKAARDAGVKVALSLSDPFCVNRHKEDFLRITRDHVDLLIGNDEEAQTLTDTETPEEAARAMSDWCDLAAITMGSRGSILREGDRLVHAPCYPVTPVDTTGAGDIYAAGLLYGLTRNLSLETSGRLAASMAAQVVSKLGPRIDSLNTAWMDEVCGTWR
jgi:sugar/nucleoside kinase (ribokinase family)